MDPTRVQEILEKIPTKILLVVYLAYLGLEYYNFENAPESPKAQLHAQVVSGKDEVKKLETQLKQMNEFVKTLEAKKLEVRNTVQQLQEAKAVISDKFDIPAFMKMTFTEARHVGLTVKSLTPGDVIPNEYYIEQPFVFEFKGIFNQLVAFLDRIGSINEIIKVETMNINTAPSRGPYAVLVGTIELRTYQYLGSHADQVGEKK